MEPEIKQNRDTNKYPKADIAQPRPEGAEVEQKPEEPKKEYEEKHRVVDGRKVLIREFMIPWEDGEEKVQVKKGTFKEKYALMDRFMNLKVQGKGKNVAFNTNISMEQMMLNTVHMAYVLAPFPNTIEEIGALPEDVGELIYKHADALNKVSEAAQKNLKGDSSTD